MSGPVWQSLVVETVFGLEYMGGRLSVRERVGVMQAGAARERT